MALERIDPFSKENKFTVDHLHRYYLVRDLVSGRKIIDAACGLGFGSGLIAQWGAAKVVGLDSDRETINQAQKDWAFNNLIFENSTIESYADNAEAEFDLILSFETLEHVESLEKVLGAFKNMLKEGGCLMGSVPAERDILEENSFHLRHFTRSILRSELEKHFSQVQIFEQVFALQSSLNREDQSFSVVSEKEDPQIRIKFEQSPELPDSYVFVAGNAELPDLCSGLSLSSRAAWLNEADSFRICQEKLDYTSNSFKQLFFEHADLKRRFSNMLGWGKYYYQLHEKKEVPQDYLAKIESAKGKREEELLLKVKALQSKIDDLEKKLLNPSFTDEGRSKKLSQFKSSQ